VLVLPRLVLLLERQPRLQLRRQVLLREKVSLNIRLHAFRGERGSDGALPGRTRAAGVRALPREVRRRVPLRLVEQLPVQLPGAGRLLPRALRLVLLGLLLPELLEVLRGMRCIMLVLLLLRNLLQLLLELLLWKVLRLRRIRPLRELLGELLRELLLLRGHPRHRLLRLRRQAL